MKPKKTTTYKRGQLQVDYSELINDKTSKEIIINITTILFDYYQKNNLF